MQTMEEFFLPRPTFNEQWMMYSLGTHFVNNGMCACVFPKESMARTVMQDVNYIEEKFPSYFAVNVVERLP